MDEAGVDAAIIHTPSWDPGSHEMALAAVRDFPHRFAIMGTLPLEQAISEKKIPNWKNKGEFISSKDGKDVLRLAEDGNIEFAQIDKLGSYSKSDKYLDKLIKAILALPYVDAEAIKNAKDLEKISKIIKEQKNHIWRKVGMIIKIKPIFISEGILLKK